MPAAKRAPEPALSKLDWKEKLVQTGKNASNDATQRRLKALHEKLKALEQDVVDIESLDVAKKELLHNTLLLNKDKGVKAYTACCQADLLRLYAPDAPFTDLELKDIFSFMAIQLRTNLRPHTNAISSASASASGSNGIGAGGRITDVPFFGEYSYLLNSLAEIRSICLVPDLPGGDELVVEWFEAMFMSLRTDMSKAMLGNIEGVLTALIEESDTVPEDVIRKLLNQLTDYQERPEHPGFSVAANVIKGTAQKLQRYMLTYFSDIQLAHARDPTPEDFKLLSASHDLLVLLFTHAPESLLNTLPQLSEALLSEELQLRSITTTTLGKMFGSPNGSSNISAAFGGSQGLQSYWNAWMGRRADKAAQVRLAWVESVRRVLEARTELSSQLEAAIREKLEDLDERVRAACCKLFGELDYEVALRNIDVSTLKAVVGRLHDRKASVSEQAHESLGILYNLAFSEIEDDDPLAITQFAWIPESIFKLLYDLPTREQKVLADSIAAKYIVPLPADGSNEAPWVDRLITVTKHMDTRAFDALMALSNLAEPNVRPYEWFIGCCEQYNGGVIDSDATEVKRSLEDIASFLTRQWANPSVAKQHLLDFAAANEKRLYSLFHANADEGVELKTLVKNQSEILRRMKQSQPGILPTFGGFSRKISRWIVNRSSIATLLARAARPDLDPTGIAARKILHFTAKYAAGLFRFHTAELQRSLLSEKSAALSQVAIHAMAQLAKLDPSAAQKDKKLARRAITLATQGSGKEAKFAARYLAYSDKGQDCSEGIEAVNDALLANEEEAMLPNLRAAAEFAKSSTKRFMDMAEATLQFTLSSIMERNDAEPSSSTLQATRPWTDEQDLKIGEKAKILGLRLVVAYCIAIAQDATTNQISVQCVDLLKNILANDGRTRDDASESDALIAHLRLTAALGLMKMARFAIYEMAIDEDAFEAIVLIVQDTIFQVRYAFLKKYWTYVKQATYTSRWQIVPFFTAHDPEADCIDLTRQIFSEIHANPLIPTRDKIEKPFARFLLSLSRHPDFADRDPEDFVEMSKYLRLYIDQMVRADNISLLYHAAQRLMTIKDARDPDSDAIYMISELAQLMLQTHANARGWTIANFQGHISLASDLFKRLPSAAEAARIRKQVYLPEGMAELLIDASHKPRVKRAPVQREPTERKPIALKRKSNGKTQKPAKRARKSLEAEDGATEDESEDKEEESEAEEGSEEDSGSKASQLPADEDKDKDKVEVLGRGGRRAAKRKPPRNNRLRKPDKRPLPGSNDSGSDLTDLEDEDL